METWGIFSHPHYIKISCFYKLSGNNKRMLYHMQHVSLMVDFDLDLLNLKAHYMFPNEHFTKYEASTTLSFLKL